MGANNTGALAAFRLIADTVRRIPEAFGQRTTNVTLRVRVYSGPVGASGTTLVSTTDTVLEAGLGFAVAWDKPDGFIGREAMAAARTAGATRDRIVSLFIDDPDADLFGGEPLLVDDQWTGYVRAAAFGHTLGGPVALAQVHCDDGVTAAWLAAGRFEVHTPARRLQATVQLGPFYDPQRIRILAD